VTKTAQVELRSGRVSAPASASTRDACSSSDTFLRSVDASALSVLDRCSTWAAAAVARSAVSASQEGR
jgi:hypothetical protein